MQRAACGRQLRNGIFHLSFRISHLGLEERGQARLPHRGASECGARVLSLKGIPPISVVELAQLGGQEGGLAPLS